MKYLPITIALVFGSTSLPANAGLFEALTSASYHSNKRIDALKAEMTALDDAYLEGEISEKEFIVRKDTLMFITLQKQANHASSASRAQSSGMSSLCKWAIQDGNKSGIAVHCN